MQIGVIGVNHKSCPLEMREKLKKAFEEIFGWHREGGSYILLSTCNRIELYVGSEDLPDEHGNILKLLRCKILTPFEHWLYSYFELDCFLHLARVTAGLDSLVMGESEIQHQVKMAYEKARAEKELNYSLHYVFQKSLKIGKDLRSSFSFYQSPMTLQAMISLEAKHHFPEKELLRVLFIGNSTINRKMIRFFYQKKNYQMTLCSRSFEHADLEDFHNLRLLSRKHLRWSSQYDVIISATKTEGYVLYPCDSMPENKSLIIDLGMPRNIHPDVLKSAHVKLMNLEELVGRCGEGRHENQVELKVCREGLESAVLRHGRLFATKQKKVVVAFPSKEGLVSQIA